MMTDLHHIHKEEWDLLMLTHWQQPTNVTHEKQERGSAYAN